MRKTTESLLISALINNPDDPELYRKNNLHPDMFVGWKEEFEWFTKYVERTGSTPTPDEITTRFSDFSHSENQIEVGWHVSEILESYAKRTLKSKIADSTSFLASGDVSSAYDALGIEKPGQYVQPSGLFDIDDVMASYEAKRDTVGLPWDFLQGATDGIGRGELWYFAARPAQGKSYSLMAIAADAVLNGKSAIFYSLEMPKDQVQQRIHTILAHRLGYKGITHTGLRRRSIDVIEYRKLMRHFESHIEGNLHIVTPADAKVTPSLVSSKADDYDLSLVDYVGLMHSNTGKASIEDWRVAAQISNELRAVSLARNARIIAAAQVGRVGDMKFRQSAPKLSQLSQTDALGQDGDVVVTMNRYAKGALTYSLEKNRHGESHIKWFSRFDPEHGDFSGISRETAEDILSSELYDDDEE